MNKKLRTLLIVLGVIFISYSILSIVGILKMYNSPTTANEPNLKMNSNFFVSNVVSPKTGDFVCYRYEDKIFGKQIRVHKLCGMENDIVEIKSGIVYLNGVNIDVAFEHVHFYHISKQEYENIIVKEKLLDMNAVFMVDENNVNVALEDLIAKKYGLTAKRVIDKKGKVDKTISQTFKKNWNKDNFGPLQIPTAKVFVIGDNRDNSEDSRYMGFVNANDIVGVVVFNGK